MKSFLFAPLLLGALALPFRSSPAPDEEGARVVGPSVLMNARAQNGAAIFDLRVSGRKVPGARNPALFSSAEKRAVFLLGEPRVCARFASDHDLKSYFVVPPRSIEFELLEGVPQLSPQEAKRNIEREGWPLFDVSEAQEFASSRLPASRRLSYLGFEQSSVLPRHRPFIVACRVGHRSQLVVRKLRALGFDARNLNGGLWAWECAGLPLETSR
jgi:rhodanese-related sulfurtransferase